MQNNLVTQSIHNSLAPQTIHNISTANPGGRAVCGFSIAGIAGSNPARDMDVCLLCLMCNVRYSCCDEPVISPAGSTDCGAPFTAI